MVSKYLLLQDETVPHSNRATFLKTSSGKRQRSEQPTTMKTKETSVPRAGLRRAKSLPTQLDENEYSGKHLFWFARNATLRQKVSNQKCTPFKTEQRNERASQVIKPPRPLMHRLFGVAPANRRIIKRRDIEQPSLASGKRADSFETASTITMDDDVDEDDEIFANYSDDEDEDDLIEEDGEGMLRGLSFLEEERE